MASGLGAGQRRREVALQSAVALETSLGLGICQRAQQRKNIAEAVNDFLTAKVAEGIAEKTLTKYRRELDEFATFAINNGTPCVHQIDASLFMKYRNDRQYRNLLTKSDPIHEKTLYVALMIIRGFLRSCVRLKLLATYPIEDVRTMKPVLRPHYPPPRQVVNAVLDQTTDPLRLILMTLAFTGMRSGELQALRKTDVDLEGNWVSVQTLKAKLTRVRPIRHVPIHGRLRVPLEEYVRAHAGGRHDLLFTDKAGGSIDQGALNKNLQAVAAKLDFPTGRKNDGLVVHSLRHFFETETVNAGIPQRVIDTWLGHAGDRSMGAVYYRLSEADSQEMMKRVKFQ